MHIYVYDSYVNQKKFESTIIKIETRLTDLGLNGKIIRLGMMNSVYSMVEEEIRKGAKTIIAVGGDHLFNQIINSVAKQNSQIPVGFIPISKKYNKIYTHLGINLEDDACDTISARRIKEFDLGIANNIYFLTQVDISSVKTKVEIDENYTIEITEKGEVSVINIPRHDLPNNKSFNPNDGKLELFINTKKGNNIFQKNQNFQESIFSFKKIRIINHENPVYLDYAVKIPTPVDVRIANEKINVIIGKNTSY